MANHLISVICDFLTFAGIKFKFTELPADTFLPGLQLQNGCLLIDKGRLLYPGDILHEAGHLATAAPEDREKMTGNLENNNVNQGGEIMAIAWSYAACIHLSLDPKIVFHQNGYRSGGDNLIEAFENGSCCGQPLLQWAGMTYFDKEMLKPDTKPFPYMQAWVRTSGHDGLTSTN